MADAAAVTGDRRVRFGRRYRRGVILGLGWGSLGTIGAGLVVVVLSLFIGGVAALVASMPVWGPMLAISTVPIRIGTEWRPLVSWSPLLAHWAARKAMRQTSWRARPDRPRPAGTLALPGDAAGLRVVAHPGTGAAMVHDPHARTLTAGLRVRHPAFVLSDADDQDRKAEGWGSALATLCRSEGVISRVQVLERTLPESSVAAESYWRSHGIDDPGWAATSYRELLAEAAPAAEQHETWITLSLDMRRATKKVRTAGGGTRGAAELLAGQLSHFKDQLANQGLVDGGWLTPPRLAEVVRGAYDPASSNVMARGETGRDLHSAGPLAIEEDWGCLRADSAWHCVLWVSEWPRVAVPTDFLWPLLLTSGVRRTVSVIYAPVSTRKALKQIGVELTDHEANEIQRTKHGVRTTVAHEREHADVQRRESELESGAGEMRYLGLVTVSAWDREALDTAVERVIDAAGAAKCELRVLWGEQAQAFAAGALPLGRGLK